MKSRLLILFCLFCGTTLFAQQEKMYIHKSDNMTLGALVSLTDSIYFSSDGITAYFKIGDTLAWYPVSETDSLTFGPDSDTIFVTYQGTGVSVINPLAFEGVYVTVSGADVTISSTTDRQDICYHLNGTTADGTFKAYSAKRFNLLLDNVSITNPDGPAINIQSEKKCSVFLYPGTANILTDGITYAAPPGTEEQSGTFFSEAKLVFTGTGSLVVNGLGSEQHGLCSDDEIEVDGGAITVNSAVKDGIHAGDGFIMTGGSVAVTPTGDGIDASDATINVSGGSITVLCNTDGTKGLTSDSGIVITGGTIDITTTGDAVLVPSGSGFDPSYCTAVKSSRDVLIGGADITILCSGKAGKGISSDANIIITSGNVEVTATGNGAVYYNPSGIKDAYVATCLSSDSSIIISGGTVITSSTGSGGKGFSSDFETNLGNPASPPVIDVTTTGTKILVSGSGPNATYAEAKALTSDSAVHITGATITISSADDGIKSKKSVDFSQSHVTISESYEGVEAPFITMSGDTLRVWATDDCINATFGNGGEMDDGSLFTMAGGYLMTNSSGGDGLDSNGDMTMLAGKTVVHGPPSAPEVGADVNGTWNMNGGFMVISGTNSNMTEPPATSSQQYCVKVMMNQSQSASTLFHIQNSSGTNLLTFQPARAYYSIIFSSADLLNGSTYSIYTGGTSTGTNTDGLYEGGVYSGGTFRKSFTVSQKITNVSF